MSYRPTARPRPISELRSVKLGGRRPVVWGGSQFETGKPVKDRVGTANDPVGDGVDDRAEMRHPTSASVVSAVNDFSRRRDVCLPMDLRRTFAGESSHGKFDDRQPEVLDRTDHFHELIKVHWFRYKAVGVEVIGTQDIFVGR